MSSHYTKVSRPRRRGVVSNVSSEQIHAQQSGPTGSSFGVRANNVRRPIGPRPQTSPHAPLEQAGLHVSKRVLAQSGTEFPPPHANLVWLQIAISDHCSTSAVDHLRQRLHKFLQDKSLTVVMSRIQLGLINLRGRVTRAQCAMVKSWLMEQGEVVLVRAHRPALSAKLEGNQNA